MSIHSDISNAIANGSRSFFISSPFNNFVKYQVVLVNAWDKDLVFILDINSKEVKSYGKFQDGELEWCYHMTDEEKKLARKELNIPSVRVKYEN